MVAQEATGGNNKPNSAHFRKKTGKIQAVLDVPRCRILSAIMKMVAYILCLLFLKARQLLA